MLGKDSHSTDVYECSSRFYISLCQTSDINSHPYSTFHAKYSDFPKQLAEQIVSWLESYSSMCNVA